MEKSIMLCVCKALKSSENQINTYDKLYDENSGGHLGSHIKSIAENLENFLIADKIRTDTFCNLMNDLMLICDRNKNNLVSNLLKLLFFHLSIRFERSYGKNIKPNNLKPMDQSAALKEIINDDVIVISDDDDDDDTNFENTPSDHGDTFYLTESWILLLKQAITEIKSMSTFTDYINGSYISRIYYGFIVCLDYGLSVANQDSDILLVTNAIENLSKSVWKNKKNHKYSVFFNNENFPNPIIQVLATSFRAIVEACKISH